MSGHDMNKASVKGPGNNSKAASTWSPEVILGLVAHCFVYCMATSYHRPGLDNLVRFTILSPPFPNTPTSSCHLVFTYPNRVFHGPRIDEYSSIDGVNSNSITRCRQGALEDGDRLGCFSNRALRFGLRASQTGAHNKNVSIFRALTRSEGY